MADQDDATPPLLTLPLAEAAARLGLHPSALRSRIRRGLATATRGNDGRLLVSVPADAKPPADGVTASPEDDLAAEVDELRRQLAAETVARIKAEAERDAAATIATARVEAAERVVTELRNELARTRLPWWRRLAGG
jgi:DNA-binding Lrp family transcriptional regulator